MGFGSSYLRSESELTIVFFRCFFSYCFRLFRGQTQPHLQHKITLICRNRYIPNGLPITHNIVKKKKESKYIFEIKIIFESQKDKKNPAQKSRINIYQIK